MPYYIWVPLASLLFFIQAWLSNKTSIERGNWVWVYFTYSMLSLWPFVAMSSKNILFDGLIYDLVIMTSFNIGVIYLTHVKLNYYQILGLLIIVIGVILFKKNS